MGYDLHNKKGDYFHLDLFGYIGILKTAQQHNWQPEGTTPPRRKYWKDNPDLWDSMNYGSNDNQRVSAADADNLADALQRALDDPRIWNERNQRRRQIIAEFIVFLRRGSFTIG